MTTFARILLFLVLFQAVYYGDACSRRRRRRTPSRPAPKPCSYQTCSHTWNKPFEPRVTQGQCTKQKRYSTHVYTTHGSTEPCPSSTSCDWRYEHQTKCSCFNVYNCKLKGWNSWQGSVPQGTCKVQKRQREWGYNYRYLERLNNCYGITSSCGNNQYGQRTYCSCPYASCSPLQWTQWSVASTPAPGHCKTETRYQGQKKTILYQYNTDCSKVTPKDCPAGVTSKREKIVHCPALPLPKHGRWTDAACSNGNSVCRKTCTLTCTSLSGFNLQGSVTTRRCQADGTWSPFDARCVDVTLPTVTCPKSIVDGNDPNKSYKKLSLTGYSASDNSGKVTVTVEVNKKVVTASEYNFDISKTVHEVVVTARDEANLKQSCYYEVTIKDTEKPKLVKCPEVLRVYSSDQPATIVDWKAYVQFKDNFATRLKYTNLKGSSFMFGTTEVEYTAEDTFNNVAKCRIKVMASPHECPAFLPPKNGAQTCNIKVDDTYEQKLFCSNACQQGYGFKTSGEFYTYQCEKKHWNGVIIPDDGGLEQLIKFPLDKRPWSDCVALDSAEGVKKTVNAYVGKCKEKTPEQLEAIKEAFVKTLSTTMYSEMYFCYFHDKNCIAKNVKVYCGRSKRNGDTSMQVISVEFVVKDRNAITDKAKAAKQHQMMKLDLDAASKKSDGDIIASIGLNGQDAHIESYETKIACKDGEVMHVDKGDGDEIVRSYCVKCEEGTFFDKDDDRCTDCPEGTYQDAEGSFACKKCPDDTWTAGVRAGNQTECLDICGPGEYSQLGTGLANCLSCPIGKYQPGFRQSACLDCPSGKTTKESGTASEEDCI